VTRLLGAIVYNWPLKLAAIALATLLYGGLILSENARTSPVSIQVEPKPGSQPAGTIIVGQLPVVSEVRYFIADQSNVTVSSSNFNATVDLSGMVPSSQAQSVRVEVVSADPRIQVISSDPAFASVRLEKLDTHVVPIVVIPGTVPDGLSIRPPVPARTTATVSGAQSDIARVVSVRATVPVDASGLDTDQDLPLTPVDQVGEQVRGVEVDPATVRVTMQVFKDRRTASLPIVANVVGSLAPGFEVAGISLSDPVVGVEGDAADLADVATASTEPISLDGRSADFDVAVGFALPPGVSAVKPTSVTVHVTVRAVTESRNFTAGIVVNGGRTDRLYTLSVPSASVTVGGTPVDLDRLTGASLSVTADVSGLEVGVHEVTLTMSLQSGLTVIAIRPATVTVTVSEGPAASAPAASAATGG
jgi:YbbR domain-containing protein